VIKNDFMISETLPAYRYESGDLLSVLDELHTHTLADGRVGLLGLNADLFEHDALCMGRTTGGGGLVDVTEGALLVALVRLCNRSIQTSSKVRNYQVRVSDED
jgi:hypothetical protein